MTTKRHCPRPYYSSRGRAWGSYLRTNANHNVPTQDSVTSTQEHEVQCVFGVHDVNEELVVSVCHQDDEQSGLFYGGSELVGRVSIPVSSVTAENNCTLPPAWYALESPRTAKIVMIKVCALEKSRERDAVERDQEKQKEKRKVRKAKIVMIKVTAPTRPKAKEKRK
ncbi:hypothetical protein ACFX19_044263 [Malus domestica]